MTSRIDSKILAISLLVIAGFVCIFNEAEMNIALPAIAKLYGIEVTLTQWLTTGYMLVTGTFMPLSAFVMGRFGSRRTVLGALSLLLVGLLLSSFATSFPLLLAGRLIQALGCAFFIPVMMAVVVTLAPKEKFGTYNGVMMLVLMAAPAISPTLAGLILSTLGIKWMFYIIIPVLLALIGAIAAYLPETIKPKPSSLDVPSVVLSLLGFGGVVFAVGNAASAGFLAATTLIPCLVGAVALVVYTRRQLALDQPILNLRIFGNARYRYSIIFVGFLQAVLFGTILIGPLFLQEIWGMSAFDAGLLLLPSGVITAIANLLAGMAFDRIGTRVVPFGLTVSAVGYLGVAATVRLDWGAAAFAALCAVYAAGLPFAMTALNSNSLGSLEPHEFPDGSSLNNTIQQVTGSVGTAVFTIIAYRSFVLPGNDDVEPLANGTEVGFLASAAVMALVFVCYLALRRTLRERRRDEALAAV